jgi:pimeloyl-ACP methyl ester carboxylesterase
MKHVTVNGASLEYFEQGSGAPVVLVHGAPSDYRLWQPHCAALSAGYRAVAYTQRYFGRDAWADDWPPFNVRTHADDLIALLREIVAEPAHVVAWSYGAHVALTAANEEPALFRSLFVYEPGVPTYVTDAQGLAEIAADATLTFGPVFAAVALGDNEAGVRALVDGSGQSVGYFDAQPPERKRVQLDSARVLPMLLSQSPPPVLSCDDLGRLRMPAAVAWGELTRPFFGVVSRAAARCIPGRAHAAVAGATHMWPEEQPLEFTALVERFLAASETARDSSRANTR